MRELAATGASVWSDTADLTDEAAAARLAEAAVDRFGRLDVLVNNAGMTQTGGEDLSAPFVALDARRWRLSLERTLTTAANVTRAVLPGMLERRYGRVVNVSSVTGPASSYVTGHSLVVGGGNTLQEYKGPPDAWY
jgi:3-oxoacyl-[acyl-carrier protein] reductase